MAPCRDPCPHLCPPGTAAGAQPQPCVEAPAHVPSIRLSAQERLCFLGGVWLKDDNKASEGR